MAAKRLIRPSDIARLAEVSAAAVANWRARARDFPELADGTTARPLYEYDAVVAWLRANGKKVRETTATDLVGQILDSLRGSLGPEQAGRLVLSLLVVRKIALSNPAVADQWAQAAADGADTETVLDDLLHHAADAISNGRDLLDVDGLRLPPLGSDLAHVLDELGRIAEDDLANAALALIDRMMRAGGRMSGEFGGIGSAPAQILASLATRTNMVDVASGYVTRQTREAHAAVAVAMPDILASLSPAEPATVVYDPACGIGDALFTVGAKQQGAKLVGRDISTGALRIARQRAFLSDIAIDLELADSVTCDPWPGGQADAVVLEPPFGLRPAGKLPDSDKRWRFGTPNGAAADFAWLQDAVAHIAPGGRGYVLQPGGPLFRSGLSGAIRRELVAAGCIEAVISLPPSLLSYTSIQLFALVLRSPSDPAQSIQFIEVNPTGRDHPEASTAATIEIPKAELLGEKDIDLTPSLRLADVGLNDIDFAMNAMSAHTALAHSIDDARSLVVPRYPAVNFEGTRILPVGDLLRSGTIHELWSGTVVPGAGGAVPEGVIRPVHLREGIPAIEPDPDIAERRTSPGDILVTTQHGTRAIIDTDGGHAVSRQVTVLTVNEAVVRPEYVVRALLGAWNEKFQRGTAIKHARVRDLEVPIPNLAVQDELLAALAAAEGAAKVACRAQEQAEAFITELMAAVRYGADLTSPTT